MKIYTRINYLITIIAIVFFFNYYGRTPDKIGYTCIFLFFQFPVTNCLGLLMIDEDYLEGFWQVIINDIITIYKETKNIIKFYLNI